MKTSKRRKKSIRPAVRGPQLPLKLGRAKGPEPERTMRVRYVEPPARRHGSPFFAVRVPAELLRAFKRYAKEKKTTMPELVREHMSKVTGVEVGGEE